jgi:Acetoacetate decarboxylase (ADC)
MTGSSPAPESSFLTRPGDLFAPAPYRVETAVFDGFVLDSGYNQLNALLAQQLGSVTGGECRFAALVPSVILTYISIARSFSLTEDKSQAGYYLENDLMCWVVVAQFRGRAVFPERVGLYAPFVWVDQPAALVEGREGFGYPKGFGTISIPAAGAANEFRCDAYTFPGDRSAQLEVRTVSRIAPSDGVRPAAGRERDAETPGAPQPDDLAERWTTAEQARGAILARLVDNPSTHHFAPDLPPIDLARAFAQSPWLTFLMRQFRSAVTPAHAVCQEIVAAPFAGVTFHGGGIRRGEWTADFPVLPALDLPALLGVGRASRVLLAYRVALDTTLAPGSVVWSYPSAQPRDLWLRASRLARTSRSWLECKLRELGRRQRSS